MPRYKIKIERTQRGIKLDWEKELIVECTTPPKIGEGVQLLVNPPIYETIVSVEELDSDTNVEKAK
jgi:hypothetical protein